MRVLAVVTTALAVLAAVWFVVERRAPDPSAALGRPGAGAAGEGRPGTPARPDAGAGPAGESAGAGETGDEARATANPAGDPPAGAGPTCRILGRVVDAAGRGLGDVQVSLSSVGAAWAAGVEADQFETRSDEDGHFALETPLPTSDWISLTIRPPRFHALTGRDFGPAGGRDRPPLVEGTNDLGTFTLAATGAVAGTVRSADGGVPERARVRLDGSFPGGYVLGAGVGEAGRFEIAHVPPGVYPIEALAEGYLTNGRSVVEVRVLEVSSGHDIVLEPAPRVSGVVVDEGGQPLADVRLWGWPLGSGQGAGARTDARGRFTVHLPQEEPYSFTAEMEGYVTYGGDAHRGAVHEPGTESLRIVLEREVETTFAVVDARTGKPVERFGLKIDRKPDESWSSSSERDELPPQDVPGGVSTAFADPERHAYSIQAPGYGPQRAPVQHESPTSARQTIRLEPEGRLRGRVVFEGRPLAGATVRVERAPLASEAGAEPAQADVWANESYDLDEFTGRLRMRATGAQGGFDVGELAAGTYRLSVASPLAAPHSAVGLEVAAGEVLDLGELQLAAGATVRGRVVAGLAPAGLEILLDEYGDEVGQALAADGGFSFGGLAAGPHTLVVADAPGIVRGMEPFTFELAAGETREVQLDLSPWQPCRVRVRAVTGDRPLAGARVILGRTGGSARRELGRTDAQGELRAECEGGSDARFELLSANGLLLATTPAALELVPGQETPVEISAPTGRLALLFPADFRMPEHGSVTLTVRPPEATGRRPVHLTLFADAGDLHARGARWSGLRNDLGPVAPGTYEVRAELRVRPDGEGSRGWRAAGAVWVGSVEVADGEAATCALRAES